MKRILLVAVVTFLVAPTAAFALDGFPAFPMALWGTVTINGSAAPVGTVVRAYYGSNLAGSVVVQEAGIYGYTESTKQKLVVAEGTGTLSFKVQSSGFNSGAETAGDTPVTASGFVAGQTAQKSLAFTIPVPSSSSASSSGGGGGGGGSSGGGGGGGGGGGVVGQVLGASTTKGDATGDGKVDILDFNSLLIQWGKSGSGLSADLDGNGTVDIFDFNQLLINWSK